MKEKPDPRRTNDAAPESDERENDGRSSLERLADLTRRVLRVPKNTIQDPDRVTVKRKGG